MSLLKRADQVMQESFRKDSFWKIAFCKSLYSFLLLKIFYSWFLVKDLMVYAPVSPANNLSKLLFAPLLILPHYPNAFWICFVLLLVTALALRLNYITAFLIFWFSISYSRLLFPVLNGSDLVLNLFLMIGVLIPVSPSLKGQARDYQLYLSHYAVLLIRVELALIYFLSGFDKLITEAWRNGAAIFSAANLDFFINPVFNISLDKWQLVTIAWAVIVFELAFSVLIWFSVFRKYLLILGVLFHLGIVVFMGLVDFGLLMIISYTIFFPLKENRDISPVKSLV
ncbi:MAG: hypothetical protein DYG99_10830 [Bacteroidetes bacterium CHB5]|nr:hypothetical protein [Bacteroidetes bacterium CHB5]